MSFSWIPIYEELATALLAYHDRQGELLRVLDELNAAGIPALPIQDRAAGGAAQPLREIDPFTFFASFNRNTKLENRIAVLERMKAHFKLQSAVPTDFDGIPVADMRLSWFFPYSFERAPDDIGALWKLASEAVRGGRNGVSGGNFDRCMRIKTVKISKLTMGLFWLRPREFLPVDAVTRAYLESNGVKSDRIESHAAYKQLVDATAAKLGSDFPGLSLSAFLAKTGGQPPSPRPVRYWAGGHQFGDEPKAEEFLRDRSWYIGWSRDADSRSAVDAWRRIAEIRPGDLFAIKGYGGRNHLRIHAVGRVEEVDAEKGRLRWSPVDVPLFRDEAPGLPAEGETWFGTLLEVTNARAVEALFQGKSPVKKHAPERPDLPLNLILHGPPGTGKTFRMQGFRKQFASDEVRRIPLAPEVANLTWFDVVALALHGLGRPAEAREIMEHPLVQAKYLERAPQTKLGPFVWGRLQTHTIRESTTVHYSRRRPPLVFDKHEDGRWFLPKRLPEELLSAYPEDDAAPVAAPDNQFFVTFHPSFTYEDFVEGIRPETDKRGRIRYSLLPGIFKQACERAIQLAGFHDGLAAFCVLEPAERRERLADAKPVVLFVDEINRGNVARILGELITLIEPDKRLGADQELIVTLPGSRQRFGVPSNLWIVGTMNTADRSVVALDVALRRRFAFVECPPDPTLLAGVMVEGVDIGLLLSTINRRLLVLRDRDHLIGHAFFLPLKEQPTLAKLRQVFRESVLPLLVEYFHDDLGRVGLVLGPAFVAGGSAGNVFAMGFEHDHREDLAERPTWSLLDPGSLPIDAFRSILDA